MSTSIRWLTTILLVTALLHHNNATLLNLHTIEAILQHQKDYVNNNVEGYTYNIPTNKLNAEYDFIVVGAGPSGSVVTNRLTEVPKWSVLLLEAGVEEIQLTDMPVFVSHFQHTNYNWGYRTQQQEGACLGLRDKRCAWPRGKGMGGSSILNYMIYTRGHPKDFDEWETNGNPGWGWDEVMKYYLKSENAHGDFANSAFHSEGGYMDVTRVPYRTKLSQCFIDSAMETGNNIIDYNSGELLGFSLIQATLRNGSRCSASKGFLRPIRNRRNLHVAKQAQVTKILINPETRKAYGVEFHRGGRRWSVRARKEVIISAGAINTPQLLMLSGIGPRDHLESLDIPVINDLPGVGNNLQEHVSMCGLIFQVNDTVSITEERLLNNLKPISDYVNHGSGPITVPGGVEALGYIRTPIAKTPKDYPDVELIFVGGHLAADNGRVIRTAIGITDEIYNEVYKPINSKDAWTIWPMILRPESRGWIRLKNKNPLSWPIMYANYFEDEHDLNMIVEGIKYVIELSKTQAFQRYNSTLLTTPIPGCKDLEFGSDEYWKCTVRHLTTTLHHQCGTAKMGPGNDPMAVVDHELRVYGIKGLRVVDASIIPRIPAAHLYAPCMMIGEKAADMIKKTYGKS
jgi:choline dehydrogenase